MPGFPIHHFTDHRPSLDPILLELLEQLTLILRTYSNHQSP